MEENGSIKVYKDALDVVDAQDKLPGEDENS
jgi:hypothetical protein